MSDDAVPNSRMMMVPRGLPSSSHIVVFSSLVGAGPRGFARGLQQSEAIIMTRGGLWDRWRGGVVSL